MGKSQSREITKPTDKKNGPVISEDTRPISDQDSDKSAVKKDLVISFNDDFTNVDVQKVKTSKHNSRRMSRMDKLKSRKLPHTLKIQIIEEDELEESLDSDKDQHKHKGSDHHMSHLEKIKRRKMPAGKRLFGEHYHHE